MEILRSFHDVKFASGLELRVESKGIPIIQDAVDYIVRIVGSHMDTDLMERADEILERCVKSKLIHTCKIDLPEWDLVAIDDTLYSVARVFRSGQIVKVEKEVVGLRVEYYRMVE